MTRRALPPDPAAHLGAHRAVAAVPAGGGGRPAHAEPDGTDLARAARGEPDALHRVLSTVQAFVVPYCRARIGPTAEAERLARTVCLDIVRALPHHDPGRPFLATVHTAAEHAVTAHPANGHRGLVALLPTLPTHQREVLVLRVALGLSTRRTAELLALTEPAVRTAQHQALHRLRSDPPQTSSDAPPARRP